MGVVNTKSTSITNAEASPAVMNANTHQGGVLRIAKETVAIAAADDNDSTFRFVRISAHAVVDSIEFACDALSTGASYAFGVYATAADGGAAIDADCWADAVDCSAAVARTDITYEKTATDITKAKKAVWEIAGVSTAPAPGTMYDIVATATAAGTAAGDMTVWVKYTDGT